MAGANFGIFSQHAKMDSCDAGQPRAQAKSLNCLISPGCGDCAGGSTGAPSPRDPPASREPVRHFSFPTMTIQGYEPASCPPTPTRSQLSFPWLS